MFFRKEETITTAEKINNATIKVQGAMKMFEEAHTEINYANAILAEAIKEDEDKIEELEANKKNAIDQFIRNNKLKEKLSEFIL